MIILTTNLGTKEAATAIAPGFQPAATFEGAHEQMKRKVSDELKQYFRPEFLNRIDETIVFHRLDEEHLLQICTILTERIRAQLRQRDVDLKLTDRARRFLVRRSWSPAMGARPLRRTIQREIEDTLSERILLNDLLPGQIAVIDCEGDPADTDNARLVFTYTTDDSAPDAPGLVGVGNAN